MRPFQLSYKPLGEPDPLIFNLGVAVLLVRFISYLGSKFVDY